MQNDTSIISNKHKREVLRVFQDFCDHRFDFINVGTVTME